MRLLHTTDLTFEEFFDSEVPRYAILSHRWISGQEVSYQDFVEKRIHDKLNAVKSGWEKVVWFARLARETYDCEWCWVDTCCIDKRSTAELTEAINSMYQWYNASAICVAYLFDVDHNTMGRRLEDSQWFKRGWTLQELLAPKHLVFYAGDHTLLGHKYAGKHEISTITGIREDCLNPIRALKASIAEKFSWASHRETTRLEDTAYCLMGLLEVNMPLLYGEGTKAFLRLQRQLIEQSDDESFFAWFPNSPKASSHESLNTIPMLATSPRAFEHCGNITRAPMDPLPPSPRPPYAMTHKGLVIQIPSPPNWISDEPRFALLQLDAVWFAPETPSIPNWIFLLVAHSEDDSWVRIDLPFHMVSRGSHTGWKVPSEARTFQSTLIRNPRTEDMYTTSGVSIGIGLYAMAEKFVEFVKGQDITLSALKLYNNYIRLEQEWLELDLDDALEVPPRKWKRHGMLKKQ